MSKLTTKTRNKLPKGDFAVPGRKYPINDKSHARNALSRVSANGTPEEKAEVRSAVKRKFPSIGKTKKGPVGANATPKQMMEEASATTKKVRKGDVVRRFKKYA